MHCPDCQHVNEPSANFCEECGGALSRACSGCGLALKPTAKFCPQCGRATAPKAAAGAGATSAALESGSTASGRDRALGRATPAHLAEKILSSRSAVEGERKRVSVLFSDIQGSMELSEQLDPEQWHLIMDRFFQIMTEGVHRFEGTVNQYTGDGVMALFGAPIAHEDHAQRACFAALRLQSELRKYANELRIEHGLSINVRIGIHSGEVVVGNIGDDLRMEYTAQGHTVGLAARMQQIAEPGKAYLTGATEELVRGYFALESLGLSKVKGVAEPVAVFALGGLGEMRTRLDVSRSRGFSKFVGRCGELEALENALGDVVAGEGRVVSLVAEAGTGKSRLCFEFTERCRERGVTVYETYCLPHGRTLPLFPILQLYRGIFGITDGDSPERARDKIAGRIVLIDAKLIDTLPMLFDFLGVPDPQHPVTATDPELRTRLILDVLSRITSARGDRGAAVVLVEDLHWIDPGSTVFLESLVEAIPGGRLLLLLNYRPEYSGDWMSKPYCRRVALSPLGDTEIDELLDHLLGRDPTLGVLRRRVREQTGGNPFFVEEVVRELVEQGHIAGSRGCYKLETPVESIPVPGSVQGVLAARIDRLDDDSKGTLQAASAIGRDFSLELLAAATGKAAEELEAVLSRLIDDQFVYATSLYPEPEYSFKHALTRDVAYESILGARKRELHAAVGRALEASVGSVSDERAALIADHYERAGDPIAAAHWHERAALWIGTSNVAESYEHWRKVRVLTDGADPSPALRTQRVRACCQEILRGLRGGADVDSPALLAEARRALPGCDDPHAEIRVLMTEGSIAYLAGDFHVAFPVLDRALANARSTGDDRLISEAVTYWQVIQSFRDPAAGLALLEEIGDVGIAGASEVMGFAVHGWNRAFPAVCVNALGDYADAMSRVDAAVDAARAAGDPIDIALTISLAGNCLSMWGQGERALTSIREARRLAEATGVRIAIATSCMGAAMAPSVSGSALPLDELVATARRFEQVAYGFQRSSLGFLQTAIHFRRRELDAALKTVRDTYELCERSGISTRVVGLVGEAEILIAMHGAEAHDDVERLLAAARLDIDALGLRVYAPRIHVVRAALAKVAGDRTTAANERELAIAAYRDMGAPIPDDLSEEKPSHAAPTNA
jgi:class 3 adenylate cyclase/tetratricopeptide (TPR) repeat protein